MGKSLGIYKFFAVINMDNPLVLEILQDIQNEKIKSKEEIQQELKLKLYQVYKPFLNFNSNRDNFSTTYDKLQGYQFIEGKEAVEGDYVRYLNPKYFYDIQLMKGGFVSAINTKKKQITLVNGNKVIKIKYVDLCLFRKLDEGDLIKQQILASLEM